MSVKKTSVAYAGITVFAAAVFAADTRISQDYAIWLLYLLPLFVAPAVLGRMPTYALAAAFSVLALLAHAIAWPVPEPAVMILSRVLGAAVLWATAILLVRRRRAEMHLKEAARHVALGADVGKALIVGQGLREALQGCAEAMVRHLDAAFARIWVLDEKEEVLELLASAGMYTHTDGFHSRLHLWKYPYKIAVIARERRPHLTNSVIGDPMVHDQEWAKREGMVAFAGYPLVFREKLAGVMGMFARKRLTLGALKALESVADEITLGIERMRAAEELRKSEEMFQSLVDESLAGAYIIQDGKLKYMN